MNQILYRAVYAPNNPREGKLRGMTYVSTPEKAHGVAKNWQMPNDHLLLVKPLHAIQLQLNLTPPPGVAS